MASTKLENCFTCFRQTDNFLRITEKDNVSGENVEAIFAKHFWFTENEYKNHIICTSCWEKIDDFHKFYCQVEKSYAPAKITEVKVEPAEAAGPMPEKESSNPDNDERDDEEDALDNCIMYVEAVCKSEGEESSSTAKDAKDDDDDNDEDDDDDASTEDKPDDMDCDSEVPLAERLAARKTKIKNRERIDFSCHRCTEGGEKKQETFKSFYRLDSHFKKVHGMNGYVFCCSRRWTTRKAFVRHFNSHASPKIDHRRCLECNCMFKDESSYAKHMFLVHTPEEAKPFKCDRCSKAFAAVDLLNSHINWHDEVETRNHHCPICNKYFFNLGNLENHNLTHHVFGESSTAAENVPEEENSAQSSEQAVNHQFQKRKRGTPEEIAMQEELIKKFITLNCSKCDFVGETFKQLTKHAQAVHKMATYSVVCCDRRFGKRFRLYEHCLRHINPDHFKCDICFKTFTDSSGLQHHKWWIHTPISERPFKCDVCGDAFVKDYLLKQHMDRHMDKERKTHTCFQCNITYTNSLQLKAHQQRIHGAVCNWVCDVCAKGFAHRALLEKHRLTHTEEGLASLKMQCEKCKKWLTNKRCWFRHRRRCYNTSGPVTCDVCGLESVNEASLMSHKKLHHSNKPKFQCSYCGKEFKKQLRMKEHEANHAGIVLYKCPFCPRMCNSSSNMYTHKKVAHPEQWAESVAARFSAPPNAPNV